MITATRKLRLQLEPNWSKYQLDVFDWLKDGSGNCQIEAVAGAGKTKTIEGIVNRIKCSRDSTAVLAFNRHSAEELTSRLGNRSGLTVSTTHKMGLVLLRRYFGGTEIKPNERKYLDICKAVVHTLVQSYAQYQAEWREDAEAAERKYPVLMPDFNEKKGAKSAEKQTFYFLQKLTRFTQLTLTEPTEDNLYKLIDHFSLADDELDKKIIYWAIQLVPKVLELGEKEAASNLNIGLDDLLWLPSKWSIKSFKKKFVIVDEAQDANAAMLSLYLKLVDPDDGRIIIVGDPKQAIQGFAGSDAYSWEKLKEATNPHILPLSVCYRCPSSHIELAKTIVPQIESAESAITGSLKVIEQEKIIEIIKPGDLVICRLTEPLILQCLALIIAGIKATIRGRDLGADLTKLARLAVDASDYPRGFKSKLMGYCLPRIALFIEDGSLRSAEALEDKQKALFACFDAFAIECKTLEDYCSRVESLFTESHESDKPSLVNFSTIHRCKGYEADRVFLLGSNFLPFLYKADQKWQVQQEWNLVYVALTRAKTELYLIPLDTRDNKAKTFLYMPLGGLRLPEEVEKKTISSKDLKVGSTVFWIDCPPSLTVFNPFTVREIDGEEITLDWLSMPVSISRLVVE